jgi:hypothetical protein
VNQEGERAAATGDCTLRVVNGIRKAIGEALAGAGDGKTVKRGGKGAWIDRHRRPQACLSALAIANNYTA